MHDEGFERDRLELFRNRGFAGESRWLDHGDGGPTYAVVRGEGACPTILVHGGIADASIWCPMAAHLPGHVVIVDRPGHGLSGPVDYRGVDYQRAAADWLLRVVDALGVEQADLVGNSMGGYFAMAFALAQPARVRRLVLAGAPAGLDRPLPLFLRLWGRPAIGRLISAIVARTTDPEAMRRRVMRDLCAHPERISVEALRVSIAAGRRPDFQRTVRSMLRAVSDLGGWRPELSMREPMTRLEVPTLFAWGDRDSFAPPASGRELAARMPAARVEVIEDAGHLVQLDQPEALAASVRAFLAAPDAHATAPTRPPEPAARSLGTSRGTP